MTTLRHASATDVGLVRSNNQDRLLEADPLFAVADGMGGHAAGEVASAVAVEALASGFSDRTAEGLAAAVRAANRAVWDQAQDNHAFRGMGTTLVALALVGSPGHEKLAVANVGDSRLYLLHQRRLVQVTTDHNVVAELVAEGQIDAEEARTHPQRHRLTRALGVDPEVSVDLLTIDVHQGDRYLLCSDGLSGEVRDDELASVLDRFADPSEAAQQLVDEAKTSGGSDNITVVVIDVVEYDELAVAPAAAMVGAEEPSAPSSVGPPAPPAALPGESTGPLDPARPGGAGGWRARRRERRRARSTTRLVTVRLIGFFVLLIVILAVGAGGVAYYARASYFVGLDGSNLMIYQGRPGGVLWFRPTVSRRPGVTTAEVLPVHLGELRAGKVEPTLGAAQSYVKRLRDEYRGARSANRPPSVPASTVPATTVPTTTTVPNGTVPVNGAPTSAGGVG